MAKWRRSRAATGPYLYQRRYRTDGSDATDSRCERLGKVVRHATRRRLVQSRACPQRSHRSARAERLGQEHDPANDCRLPAADYRPRPGSRLRRRPTGAGGAQQNRLRARGRAALHGDAHARVPDVHGQGARPVAHGCRPCGGRRGRTAVAATRAGNADRQVVARLSPAGRDRAGAARPPGALAAR